MTKFSALATLMFCLLTSILCGGSRAAETSGRGCLPGTWELDNTGLAKAIIESMKNNDSGTDFTLDGIVGAYQATINLNSHRVKVDWQNWEMTGTSKTRRSGTFKVLVRLNGLQKYKILHVADEEMAVQLERDAVNATVSFGGHTVSDPQMDIPVLATGQWTCNVDDFRLASTGFEWEFDRVP